VTTGAYDIGLVEIAGLDTRPCHRRRSDRIQLAADRKRRVGSADARVATRCGECLDALGSGSERCAVAGRHCRDDAACMQTLRDLSRCESAACERRNRRAGFGRRPLSDAAALRVRVRVSERVCASVFVVHGSDHGAHSTFAVLAGHPSAEQAAGFVGTCPQS
jgi:hypothetical protein